MRYVPFGLLAVVITIAVLACGCGGATTSTGTSPTTINTLQVTVGATTATLGAPTCPTTVTFNGSISYMGNGTLTYRWDLWDGTSSDQQSYALSTGAITPGVTINAQSNVGSYTRPVTGSGTYWAKLHVLSPLDTTAAAATVTLTCSGT